MDLWYSKTAPKFEAKISKSIIHPFEVKGYDGLTINPYKGCQHRCAYCYATYKWSPEFYDKIYAKSNAPQILEKELRQWKGKTINPVMVCSATDPYQPAELKYELTRKCVRVLQKYNVPYYVFTKSVIIVRDLELHKQYRDNCFIVWSITTCDEKVRRVVEPGTPPASAMFSVMRKFADAGINCAVNVDPIMPLITDSPEQINAILDEAKDSGVSCVSGALLRLRTDIWERMKITLKLLEIPKGIEDYKKIYRFEDPLVSNYVSCSAAYADRILNYLEQKTADLGMTSGFPSRLSTKKFRDNGNDTQQTILSSFM